MTMGEMASSVAHELNQPLAAITNYCNGMVSRVQGRVDRQATTSIEALEQDLAPGRARGADHPAHPQLREAQRAAAPAGAEARAIVDDVRSNSPASSCAAATWRSPPMWRKRLPMLSLRPDPDTAGGAEPAEERRRGDRTRRSCRPPRRHIELRVVPRHTAEEGGVIEFSVTDQGPGVREDALARLYEAFFSTKAEGLGIGLALCRSIIESHRGRMKAQNLYNGTTLSWGADFAFTLPVDPSTSRGRGRGPTAPTLTPALDRARSRTHADPTTP